jgi:hypothetical protein
MGKSVRRNCPGHATWSWVRVSENRKTPRAIFLNDFDLCVPPLDQNSGTQRTSAFSVSAKFALAGKYLKKICYYYILITCCVH